MTECNRVDLCARNGAAVCGQKGHCEQLGTSIKCNCYKGYKLVESTDLHGNYIGSCENIDECALRIHECDELGCQEMSFS